MVLPSTPAGELLSEDERRDARAYSNREFRTVVNLAALLGWLAVSAPIVLALGPGVVPLAALLGLPIAFAACWVIGAPILWRLMRRPIGWVRAAGWGAAITGLMSIAWTAFTRYLGWRQSRDPHSSSRFYGEPGVLLSDDGILTLAGWWALAQQTALFVMAGMAIALALRTVIGPGRLS